MCGGWDGWRRKWRENDENVAGRQRDEIGGKMLARCGASNSNIKPKNPNHRDHECHNVHSSADDTISMMDPIDKSSSAAPFNRRHDNGSNRSNVKRRVDEVEEHSLRSRSRRRRRRRRHRDARSRASHSTDGQSRPKSRRRQPRSSSCSSSSSSSSSSRSRSRKRKERRRLKRRHHHKHNTKDDSTTSTSGSSSSDERHDTSKKKKMKTNRHEADRRKGKEGRQPHEIDSTTAINNHHQQHLSRESIDHGSSFPLSSLTTTDAKRQGGKTDPSSTTPLPLPSMTTTSTDLSTTPINSTTTKNPQLKAKGPMTHSQYLNLQSQIREVIDPHTGRTRYVRGTGEIIERIVSRQEHSQLNKMATLGDGSGYAKDIMKAASSTRR